MWEAISLQMIEKTASQGVRERDRITEMKTELQKMGNLHLWRCFQKRVDAGVLAFVFFFHFFVVGSYQLETRCVSVYFFVYINV